MRFASSFAVVALASGVALADTGCVVDITPVGYTSGVSESLAYALLFRVGDSVLPVSGECVQESGSAQTPYTALILANCLPGYATDAELETMLDPWVGTYLKSRTSTPAEDNGHPEDFLVTNVSCF